MCRLGRRYVIAHKYTLPKYALSQPICSRYIYYRMQSSIYYESPVWLYMRIVNRFQNEDNLMIITGYSELRQKKGYIGWIPNIPSKPSYLSYSARLFVLILNYLSLVCMHAWAISRLKSFCVSMLPPLSKISASSLERRNLSSSGLFLFTSIKQ